MAIDDFFNNPPPPETPKVNLDALQALWLKYSEREYQEDSEPTVIMGQRLHQFFIDLGVDPENDISSLVIPWQLKCKRLFIISKDEFFEGFKRMNVSTMKELKGKLNSLNAELFDDVAFREFYKFMFDYAKGEDEVKKVLPLDSAIALWLMLLKDKFSLLEDWISFCRIQGKAITKDTWLLLLEFSKLNISQFNSDDAWPCMIDDFVDWYKENRK
eukprot:TRINITY_DN8263_c0_g2_i3.p1 TRINITY_DN8263_c0_g2~~TRINITY_DN8263_c0_g2_i3.p1  ORF type:complete len:215 (-),score=54.92 TRINITY_DN8263_c0_g2_i3:168-812(-)